MPNEFSVRIPLREPRVTRRHFPSVRTQRMDFPYGPGFWPQVGQEKLPHYLSQLSILIDM